MYNVYWELISKLLLLTSDNAIFAFCHTHTKILLFRYKTFEHTYLGVYKIYFSLQQLITVDCVNQHKNCEKIDALKKCNWRFSNCCESCVHNFQGAYSSCPDCRYDESGGGGGGQNCSAKYNENCHGLDLPPPSLLFLSVSSSSLPSPSIFWSYFPLFYSSSSSIFSLLTYTWCRNNM